MFRRLALLTVGVVTTAFTACQGQQFPMVPVEGVVLKDGKPLDNVKVEFHPDRESGVVGPRSIGLTDASGRFRLQTDAGEDGAVVGAHRVILVDVDYLERTAPIPADHPIKLKHKDKGPLVKRIKDDCSEYYRTPLRQEAKKPNSTVTIEIK
ncbi:DUF4198 domain-containing protein [Gemmata sp. JC717]|uniref:DUF4198 domain-containing protein n=1 Tax=Gemmata algarum TaxID=2975278 RepID=UPI0021BB24D3|nr:DUF4198 domain-containing protein [Gemmata algarum]MDY3553301.1 DUF4198 domain-containing protein [Gemmata algarum]